MLIDPVPSPAYAGAMRWDALFADLEAQLAAAGQRDLELEIDERARVDAIDVELVGRLRGSLGLRVGVHVGSGTVYEGTLSHVGNQWLVLDEARHQLLIAHAAAVRFSGLSRVAEGAGVGIRRGLGLASALRGRGGGRRGWAGGLGGAGPRGPGARPRPRQPGRHGLAGSRRGGGAARCHRPGGAGPF